MSKTAAVAMLAVIGWIAVESFRAITSSHGRLVIYYLTDEKFRSALWRDAGGTIIFVGIALVVVVFWVVVPLTRARFRSRL